MKRVPVLAFSLAAILFLLSSAPASAAILYHNGTLNGTNGGFTINQGYQVSDSFTLTQASELTGVQVGLWLSPGDKPASLDWTISTEPCGNGYNAPTSGSDFIASGTASGSSLTYSKEFTNVDDYDIYEASFSLPTTINLPAGTYYLSLGPDATASNINDPLYWDDNNGPSTAFENTIGSLINFLRQDTTGSEFFQILGPTPVPEAVPEPASLTLLGIGAFGALGYGWRRRKQVA